MGTTLQSYKISLKMLKLTKAKYSIITMSMDSNNDRYNFHILKEGIYLYICMAATAFKNKAAFAFLN